MVRDLLLLLAAYLAGAIPFGYILTRRRTGADIRSMGSGNIGATNVMRTQGRALGAVTLLLDGGKAALAVWACSALSPEPWMGAAGGAAAVVGHCFPAYIGFRGGKGVASGLGAFILIAWEATLVALGTFVLVLVLFRRVSLGSICAAAAFGMALFAFHGAFGWYPPEVPWIGAGLALLLIGRHHSNIRNLLRGAEPALWGEGSSKP